MPVLTRLQVIPPSVDSYTWVVSDPVRSLLAERRCFGLVGSTATVVSLCGPDLFVTLAFSLALTTPGWPGVATLPPTNGTVENLRFGAPGLAEAAPPSGMASDMVTPTAMADRPNADLLLMSFPPFNCLWRASQYASRTGRAAQRLPEKDREAPGRTSARLSSGGFRKVKLAACWGQLCVSLLGRLRR